MSSWARVGVKAVYIGKEHHAPKIQKLVQNQTYIIREIVQHPANNIMGCYLVGVQNPIHDYYGLEMGYNLINFRPLITPEQDIALFQALCPGLPVVPPAVVPKRVTVPSPSD